MPAATRSGAGATMTVLRSGGMRKRLRVCPMTSIVVAAAIHRSRSSGGFARNCCQDALRCLRPRGVSTSGLLQPERGDRGDRLVPALFPRQYLTSAVARSLDELRRYVCAGGAARQVHAHLPVSLRHVDDVADDLDSAWPSDRLPAHREVVPVHHRSLGRKGHPGPLGHPVGEAVGADQSAAVDRAPSEGVPACRKALLEGVEWEAVKGRFIALEEKLAQPEPTQAALSLHYHPLSPLGVAQT